MHCKSCLAYEPKTGECRAKPPVFNRGADKELSDAKGAWPLVDEGEWCMAYHSRMPL